MGFARKISLIGAGVLAATLLSSCAQTTEDDLRVALSDYLHLGATRYFKSRRTCTAAVFDLHNAGTKADLPITGDIAGAQADFDETGRAAIRVEGYSANDLADGLLMAHDHRMGSLVLEAAASVSQCLGDDSSEFRTAMTRSGGTLGWIDELGGMFVIDPGTTRLFYISGSPL